LEVEGSMRDTFFQYLLGLNRSILIGLVIVLISCFVPLPTHAREDQVDDLFGVSFPTPQDGWACGRWGTIVHSADGGITWEKQESGTDYTLSCIFFADQENGWAVGDGGTIIHTRDGGKTWEPQTSPVPYFLMAVRFASPKKGWICTERTTILHTEDGGKTWQVQFKRGDFVLMGLSFCDELNGWAVGEYGFIYHTSNGGKTWEHQAGVFGWSEETGEVIGGTYLFDVVAIDPDAAWVVGMDSYLAKTADGGETWERVQLQGPARHLFGIATDKEDTFIIGGDGTLLASSDGGKTFQHRRHDPIIAYGWLNKVLYGGAGRFFAAGKEGWVYLTEDKGDSWEVTATQ
jgi:photosystem II stability/assembly factor-like uncharacterized protein